MHTSYEMPSWEVTVVHPCDCANCNAGRRWFYCINIRSVAAYEICSELQPQPDWEEIIWIQKQHPGMTLIY